MNVIWTTRQGEKIDIRDMGDRHLDNAIAMLVRKGYVPMHEFESCARYAATTGGDMAQMAAEEALFSMRLSPVFDAMLKEQAYRKLKLRPKPPTTHHDLYNWTPL